MSTKTVSIIGVVLLAFGIAVILTINNRRQDFPISQPVPPNQKYDDASWHYDGDFPKDLPPEAGATHIGMFAAWVMLNGMVGEEFAEDVQILRSRKMTPGQFIMEQCDEKMFSEMFNVDGNRFAASYYDFEKGEYLKDYEATLAKGLPSTYHIEDSWANYDKLKPVLNRRFAEFTGSASAAPGP